MPLPTPNMVHIDRPLTNMSVAYIQSESAFVASRTFPGLSVSKQTDKYYIYNREDFFRRQMKKVTDGQPPEQGGYRLSNDSYSCDVWGEGVPIGWMLKANADAPLDPERDAMIYLTHQAMLEKEYQFAATAMATNVWGTEVTGAASSPGTGEVLQWNDADSTPIDDVKRAKRAMLLKTGFKPNVLTLGKLVYDILTEHPDIIGRLDRGQTPNGPAQATKDDLAALFEVEEILVSEAVENTAAEGATESNAFIVGRHALLSYRTRTPGIMTPSAGYSFNWTGLNSQFNDMGVAVFRTPVPRVPNTNEIQVYIAFDQKKVGADLGYFFYNIVAADS